MICETCTRVFGTEAFQPGNGPHHTELKYKDHKGGFCIWPSIGELYFVPHKANRDELRQSAQDGCSCCAWLLTQTSPPTPEQKSRQSNIVFGFWLHRSQGGVFYCVADYRPPDGGFRNMCGDEVNDVERMLLGPERDAFELIASHGSPAAVSGNVGGRPTPGPGDLSHIKTWLEDCLHNHPCHPPSKRRCDVQTGYDFESNDERPMPTRVLDLCSWEDSAAVKLINTSKKRGKYATLTYCWGPNPDRVFQTVAKTLLQRMQGIGMAQLNPLFREAVQVCRFLQIRYLWIDALCIVQDDEGDWSRESRLMCDVYSNASLTIAADGAKSPEEPLFSKMQRSKGQTTQSFSYYGGGDVQLHPYRHCCETQEVSSLNSRGWCLQERYLSRRIVHFYKSYTDWECLTTPQAEQRYLPVYISSVWEMMRPLGPGGFRDLDNPCANWYCLLTDYTGRRTTHFKDRLPGISGLRQLFTRTTGDHFVHGFWVSDLLCGLLWYRSKGAHLTRLSASAALDDGTNGTGTVPSWSWLSVLGRVHWSSMASVRYLAQDVHLDDTQCRISLKTVLVALPSYLQYDNESDVLLLKEQVCTLPALRWHEARLDIHPKDDTTHLAAYYRCFESGQQQQHTISFRKHLFVLTISRPSYGDAPGLPSICGSGLLVVATGEADGHYARVGSIRFRDSQDEDGQLSHPGFWAGQDMQTVQLV
ncbi:heterokaryon incompatibility protein-domain-containing protein [Coniella lustricola]|uniref:Heterokaryon incompatibility protein-domain-containing protein n=1 Tax=Coniella lustricola TaxID=2025994 RepID=A0A2T2ZU76_9PEZI|nr:heterokaryon incompatibility protein-domain-containing protein [Coniella lustricola]